MGVNKEDGGSGSGSGMESGALFPRLHVKETKRVGPRAPPRNKMALYEQFTFPSHRFVPPLLPIPASGRSTGSTTYTPQPSSYEGSMYRSTPGYGPMPWMPYMAMSTGPPQLVAQPSMNGSCSSTIVDCEGDLRRAPSIPANDGGRSSNRAAQANVRASTHSNVSSISSKKSRINDDCTVPVYTEPVHTGSETNCTGTAAPGGKSDKFPWRTWQQSSDDTGNRNQPLSGSYDRQGKSSGLLTSRLDRGGPSISEGTRDDMGTVMEISTKAAEEEDEGEEEQSKQHDKPVNHKEMKTSTVHLSGSEYSGSHDRKGHHCSNLQKKGSHEEEVSENHRQKNVVRDLEVPEAEGARSRAGGSGECPTVSQNDGRESLLQRKKNLDGRASEGSQISVSPPNNFVGPATGKKDAAIRSEGQTSQKYCNSSDGRACSSEENEDDDDENLSAPESPVHSYSEVCSDSDESDGSMKDSEVKQKKRKIMTRDVVNSIGEQGFWKARKLLQRQQRIFSGQVFELHRLIKVQQLLAASPGLLGDGVVYAGKLTEMSKPDQPGQKEDSGQKAMTTKAPETQEINTSEVAKQPDAGPSTSKSPPPTVAGDSLPGWYNAAQAPVMLNVTPGASAAPWGCPPLTNPAVNNWFGAMPTPNAAYVYQPYQAPFHPSQGPAVAGYNGAYRPIMCAPVPIDVPPVALFGLAGYDQRNDSFQDMYKYNSYQQQWQAAMFCPPIPSNPVGPWYGVPPMPYMDPTQRDPSGLYEKMMPGGVPNMPFLDPTHRGPAGLYDKMMPSSVSPMQNNVPHMPGIVPTMLGSALPMPYLHSQPTGSSGLYDKMMPNLQPSGHSGYMRPASESNGQGGPSSHNLSFPAKSPWTDALPGQLAGSDSDHFRAQAQFSSPSEMCQTSTPNLQRPSDKDCQMLGTRHAEDSGTVAWPNSVENQSRDSDCGPVYVSTGAQNFSGSKTDDKSKRTGESSSGHGAVSRQSSDGDHPAETQKDALPLFPLAPVLNSVEKGKSLSRLNPGVIKVVPRAMVATAESAAEILLSIQKQRQH